MTALDIVRVIKKQDLPWWLVSYSRKFLVLDAAFDPDVPAFKLSLAGPQTGEELQLNYHVLLVDKICDGLVAFWFVAGPGGSRPMMMVRDDQIAQYAPSV
ncbi:MAG TPA: hypothetical protein VJ553_02930 [Candidatus Paceibacterota bacterium]|nr:hypothetical protein [Candidatus Paceibacterota bacterium]